MTPTKVAFQMGSYFARVNLAPNLAPWPGWFNVVFDRLDPNDSGSRFTLSQPAGEKKYKATLDALPGSLLSIDQGKHGGGVCKGFYLKPVDDWGANEQLAGWQLGAGGPNVVLVQYPNGEVSADLRVVLL